MIIIPQSAELLIQEDLNEHIENAARTCYQSFENKSEGSADRMVKMLLKNGHTAMLEHGTVYFKIPTDAYPNIALTKVIEKIYDGFSSRYVAGPNKDNNYTGEYDYLSLNYRKYMELSDAERDLLNKYISKPTEYHEKRITIRIVTNLQVATELLRHRRFSFAMESTRYCNYSKGKFGNELTFITPCFLTTEDNIVNGKNLDLDVWSKCMESIETDYLSLIASGWSAQEAAQVLPKALKTELVMTGWSDTWKDFLDLRYFEKAGKVHPQMRELATLIYNLIN